MTTDDLRAWQAHMGYTYEKAAEALGISRSGFAKLLAGDHAIDKRTALACAAIAAGIEPYKKTVFSNSGMSLKDGAVEDGSPVS